MQMSLFDSVLNDTEKETVESAALIVDGNNLLNRAYYATALDPNNLMKSPDGQYTNGVNMFLKMLFRYKTELDISHLAVVFDKGRGFRKDIFPEYKGTRGGQPDELKVQFPLLEKVLNQIGVPIYFDEVYEADDLIASMAMKLQTDMKVYTLSNDKDLLQIVSDNIIQVCRKGKDDIFYDENRFKEDFNGLFPKQIIDFKALCGDTSDNIPGIPGIGDKGAMKMLLKLSTAESVIEQVPSLSEFSRYKKKVEEGKELGLLSKKLATLVTDIPVINYANDIEVRVSLEEILNCCKELGLTRLMNEINQGKYIL